MYRYTTGESSDDGALQLTQQWFVFDGVESCVDTFSINGVLTDLNRDNLTVKRVNWYIKFNGQ